MLALPATTTWADNRPDLERDVDLNVLSDVQHHAGLNVTFKTRSVRFDLVIAGCQVRQHVVPVFVRSGRVRDALLGICDFDFGVWNDCATAIHHPALYLRNRHRLRACGLRQKSRITEETKYAQNQAPKVDVVH